MFAFKAFVCYSTVLVAVSARIFVTEVPDGSRDRAGHDEAHNNEEPTSEDDTATYAAEEVPSPPTPMPKEPCNDVSQAVFPSSNPPSSSSHDVYELIDDGVPDVLAGLRHAMAYGHVTLVIDARGVVHGGVDTTADGLSDASDSNASTFIHPANSEAATSASGSRALPRRATGGRPDQQAHNLFVIGSLRTLPPPEYHLNMAHPCRYTHSSCTSAACADASRSNSAAALPNVEEEVDDIFAGMPELVSSSDEDTWHPNRTDNDDDSDFDYPER